MISASSAYLAAAALASGANKKPIFLVTIEGYDRAFSNVPLAGTVVTSSGVTVPATAGPWAVGAALNNTIDYDTGVAVGFTPHDFSPPIVYPRFFLAGETVDVTISADNIIGLTGNPAPSPHVYPLGYIGGGFGDGSSSGFWGKLMAAWCDSSGAVVSMVYLGGTVGSTQTLTCPGGASRLQFGVNDARYDDNSGSWLLNAASTPASIYPWMSTTGIEDLTTTVNDLEGGADLADFIFTVQDAGQLITADFPQFVFEGKQVQLFCGFYGMAVADFALLFTGRIDSVESANSNNDYVFTCPDARTELAQTIYLLGDDGFPTSDAHPRTILGHPLNILLDVLENEIGYDPSEVDEAKITEFRDGIYSGASMQFSLTSSPVAKDFIEAEIMKPLGAYLRTNNLGQITVEFAYPVDLTSVYSFSPANLLAIPAAGQTDLINQVITRMDSNGQDFNIGSTQFYQPSIDKYGLYGLQIIESKGLRSGLNGIFISRITSFLLFLRYGMKALCHGDNGKNAASDPITCIWDAALVEPGDIVSMTHPQIPDRVAGILGITDKQYLVLDRTWQFFLGNVQFKLIEVDLTKFKQYLIAGGGVADYTGAVYTISSVSVVHTIVGWMVFVTFTSTPTGLTAGGLDASSVTFTGLTHAIWLNGISMRLVSQAGAQLGFYAPMGAVEPYGPTSDTGTGTPGGASGSDQAKYLFLCNDSDQYSNGAPANTLC
jgi:hypothetical protein